MNINRKLKELRIAKGYKQSELAKMLDVTPQAISAMEKEKVKVDIDKFRDLCIIFEVSPNEILEIGEGGTYSPLEDTDGILKAYDELDYYGKEIVRKVIDTETERMNDESNVRTFIYPLIDERYLEPKVELDYYPQAAGMGKGQDVEPQAPEKLEVKASSVPEYTDFIIRATGESMLPTFEPGDYLFVQKTKHLNPGDIGVFVVDGETMVKEMGINELISHNDKYPPIKNADNCIIQGRILGKLE